MAVTASAERMRRLRERQRAEALPPGIAADGGVVAAAVEREVALGSLAEWPAALWGVRFGVLTGRLEGVPREELGKFPIGGGGRLAPVRDDGRRVGLEALERLVAEGEREVWGFDLWRTKLGGLVASETGSAARLVGACRPSEGMAAAMKRSDERRDRGEALGEGGGKWPEVG